VVSFNIDMTNGYETRRCITRLFMQTIMYVLLIVHKNTTLHTAPLL